MTVCQKCIVHLYDLVQGETTDAQDEIHLYLTVRGSLNGHFLVDSTDPLLNLKKFLFFVYQVTLVEKNAVCKSDLLNSLILNTLWLLILKMLNDVLGINKCKNAI